MHKSKPRRGGVTPPLLLLLTAYCLIVSSDVYASGLFSGLVVSQGDSASGGVKVVEIYPGCPAERAGIIAGDLIIEIDGQKIKTLDEFVKTSKARRDKDIEASLILIRKGKLQNLRVITYSEIIFKEWREKVPPPPQSSIGGLSLFQYYMEKGKAKLGENKVGGSFETRLARDEEAIRYLFYALHYNPTEVGVAILIADTHMDMARLYLENGRTPLAVENYGKAANLYEKCSRKHVAEKELELILTHLQEVEKELISLLPPEEQGPVSAEKTTIGSLPVKASP
ncbi:MAG TPA: PDZ domain-containing protein [Candidatus Tripitaka californicus]|uniref:PDZ domain-containing protein n=1 Tax=Candidatus Tripitaka californicus TaxID=3367616 RepID=UPI004025B6A0